MISVAASKDIIFIVLLPLRDGAMESPTILQNMGVAGWKIHAHRRAHPYSHGDVQKTKPFQARSRQSMEARVVRERRNAGRCLCAFGREREGIACREHGGLGAIAQMKRLQRRAYQILGLGLIEMERAGDTFVRKTEAQKVEHLGLARRQAPQQLKS